MPAQQASYRSPRLAAGSRWVWIGVTLLALASGVHWLSPFPFLSEWAGGAVVGVVAVAGLAALLRPAALSYVARQEKDYEWSSTEEMAAELRKIAALDRAVLDTAADAILVIDSEGLIVKANATAHKIFRAQPDQLLGINISRLMPDPHRSNHDGYLLEHMKTGKRKIIGSTRELQAMRLDGELFPIELSVASTKLENETLFTGFVRDTSERKRLESQLRQSEKLRSVGQLASGIAHEMNTPLQYIRVNSEYLQGAMRRLVGQFNSLIPEPSLGTKDKGLKKLQKDMLESISENVGGVERLVDIVDAMKEFSHPGESNDTRYDLNDCLNSVAKVSRNHWKHVAQLELNLADDLPPCAGNGNEISQAMLNLVINAADAIAEQRGQNPNALGQITVSTLQRSGRGVVVIEDDGPGIPPNALGRIFEPFFTTKQVGKGTGQGLAITYDLIVTKHGGTLDVENKPSGGCRFSVTLPLANLGSPQNDLASSSRAEVNSFEQSHSEDSKGARV